MIDYAAPDLAVPLSRRVLRGGLQVLCWFAALLVGVFVIGGMTALFNFGVGRFTGYIGVLGGFLLLINWGWGLTLKSRASARAILQHVHDAVRLGLPLPEILDAAAESEPRRVRKRMKRIAGELRSGALICAALEKHLPSLTLRARGLLAVGESTGQLAPALCHAMDELQTSDRGSRNDLFSFGVTGLMSLLVVGSLAVYVLPKWELIAGDFGIALPARVQALFGLSRWMAELAAPMLGIMVIVMMIVIMRLGMRVIRDRREAKPGAVRRFGQRLMWHTPVLGALVRDRSIADGLSALADAVEQGRSLPSALRGAAMPHLNDVFRERLYRWADATQQGVDLIHAARTAAMPASLIELLAVARGPNDVAGAARFVSQLHADRRLLREAFGRSVGSLVMTLIGAAIVWWIASSVILAITTMIDSVNTEVF